MTQLELDFGEQPNYGWGNYKFNDFVIRDSQFPEMLINIKPSYTMTFHNEQKTIGTIDWNGPQMTFSGDLAKSVEIMFEWLAQAFEGRLKQEYNRGYQDGQNKNSL